MKCHEECHKKGVNGCLREVENRGGAKLLLTAPLKHLKGTALAQFKLMFE